ncbi:MAG: hypothetical protein QM589_04040 [Thermomicrobiales bacterium]
MLRAFFADNLGFEVVEKPPVLAARGGIWFAGFGIQLHYGVDSDFRPARKAHPGLMVTDLDGWAGRLENAGRTVEFDLDLPGFRRFYTFDPVSNRLEFLEPDTSAP